MRMMGKKLLSLFLIIAIILADSSVVFAQETGGQGETIDGRIEYESTQESYSENGINYIITDGKVYVSGVENSDCESVVIPELIQLNEQTHQITGIVEEAFIDITGLKRIIIPDCVTELANVMFNISSMPVIYCNPKSAAEKYAQKQEIDYRNLVFSLEDNRIELKPGDTFQIGLQDEEILKTSDSEIVWKTTNDQVAAISNGGIINAIAEGETTISCTLNGLNASMELTVYSEQKGAEIADNPKESVMAAEQEFSYTISNNEATISGYSGMASDLIIPHTLGGYKVVRINSRVFKGKDTLRTVTMSKELTSSGDSLFENCMNLKKVIFEDGTEKVYDGALKNMPALEEVIFPDTITQIGMNAFANCVSLKNISIPDSVSWIKEGAFGACINLETVKLPENLVQMDAHAFYNCDKVTEVVIPKTLKKSSKAYINEFAQGFQYGAFYGCDGLRNIIFEEGVTSIPEGLFANCPGLEKIVIPNTVTEIGDSAFYKCLNLKRVTTGSGLLYVGKSAFNGCKELINIEFSDSITKIDESAFAECEKLSSIILPKSLTNLGSSAFYKCLSLTQIEIPKGVTEGGRHDFYNDWGAFRGCRALKEVCFEEGIPEIANYLFAQCDGLETITIPSSVKKVEDSAFKNCINLRNVFWEENNISIQSKASEIEKNVFSGCKALLNIQLPDSITKIDGSAFAECEKLSGIVLPKSLTNLGSSAFYKCLSLTHIEIPKGVTEGGRHDFYSDWGAFRGCSALKEVSFEEGTSEIANYLFAQCDGLETIIIPDTVKKIEDSAFKKCINLKNIYWEDNEVDIASNAFENSENITFNCSSRAYALLYAIDHDIDFNIMDGGFTIPDNSVFMVNKTTYILNSSSSISNGMMSMNLDYEIKDEVFDSLSGKEIVIKIPSIAVLVQKSLTVDGEVCTNYTEDSNRITIPIEKRKGKIRFSINPGSDGKVLSYAFMSYKNAKESKKDIIGVINEKRTVLSINTNNVTNKPTIEIFGVAPADTELSIFVNDIPAGTAKSKKNGSYAAQADIPNAVDGKVYTVKVQCAKTAASTKVKYSAGEPMLSEFSMYYGGKVYDLLDQTARENVVFVLASFHGTAAASYSFRVKFENAGKIKVVKVTSTRNSITKYMDAIWDESTQSFIAKGWFDPKDYDYVPGELSVEFAEDYDEFKSDLDKATDKILNEYYENTSLNSDNMIEVDRCENENDHDWEYIVNVSDSAKFQYTSIGYSEEEIYNRLVEENIISEAAAANTRARKSNANDIKKTLEEAGGVTAEDGSITYTHNGTESTSIFSWNDEAKRGTELVIKGYLKDKLQNPLEMLYDTYTGGNVDSWGLDEVYGTGYSQAFDMTWSAGKYVITYMGTRHELDQKYASAQTPEEKAKIQDLIDRSNLVVLMRLMCLGMHYFSAVPTPATIPLKVALYLLEDLVDAYESGNTEDLLFVKVSVALLKSPLGKYFSWIIDPSGYVYEGVSENRLEGVTTTIYYQDPDTGEAMLWDAQEYDQFNPLITDSYGNYAWDVPEGLWQVKYEKEGYETYTTDWMEVPPPRTEVNVGLISSQLPQIEYVKGTTEYIEIHFKQYMKATSLSADKFTILDSANKKAAYQLYFPNIESAPDGTQLVKDIILYPDNSMKENQKYQIKVEAGIENYAGKKAEAASNEVQISAQIELSSQEDTVYVLLGETRKLEIMVNDPTNQCTGLECISGSALVEVPDNIAVKNQKAIIEIKSSCAGEGEIVLKVPNTSVTLSIRVQVILNEDEKGESKPVSSDSTDDIFSAPMLNIDSENYNNPVLNWSKVKNISSYEIWRSDNGGKFELLKIVSGTIFTDQSTQGKHTYHYKVRGVKKVGEEYTKYSSVVQCYIDEVKPDRVVLSGIKSINYNTLEITWQSSYHADGYEIERKETGKSNYEQIKMITDASTLKWQDNNREPGREYTYRIRAYRLEGNNKIYGAYSDEKSGKAIPESTTITAAVAAGKNRVKLTWTTSKNAEGYLIYAQKNGKYGYCGMTTKGVTYTDTTALDSEYNFYWVYPYVKDSTGKRIIGKCTKYVYAKGITLAVSNLKAVSQKDSVKLSWTKSVGADGYLIYGKTASGKYGYISMTTLGTTYIHRKASKKEWNFYWVFPYHNKNGKRVVGGKSNYVFGKAK